MIGKGKTIAHTLASIKYGWNQEKQAKVVYRQNVLGNSPSEITQEFKLAQDLNNRCQKKTLSFVISPAIEDGKKLSSRNLKTICQKFIDKMKLEERQAIAFVHRDKKHLHIHLYVNRINFNGEAYRDSFIGKRSQLVAEKVAKDLNLKYPREIQMQEHMRLFEIRKDIKQRHDRVMNQYKPKSFDGYIKAMKSQDVKVLPYINKAGKLQGLRFEYKGHNLKGSAVHRSMSGGNITKLLYSDPAMKQKLSAGLKIPVAGNMVNLSGNLIRQMGQKIIVRVLTQGMDLGI